MQLLRRISHPVDDLGLCEPVVQVMVELLMADQLLVGKSQGEASKEKKGPGGAIGMVENKSGVKTLWPWLRGRRQGAEHWWISHHLLMNVMKRFIGSSVFQQKLSGDTLEVGRQGDEEWWRRHH